MMKKFLLIGLAAALLSSCGVGDLPVDPPETITTPAAISLYQKATTGNMAALREAEANFARGLNGFPRDKEKMMECWKMMGERGSVEHQRKLGLAYLHGNGVSQSDSSAQEWLTRAAAQGDEKAILGLKLLNHKTSNAESRERASQYYKDVTMQDSINQLTAPGIYYHTY